MKNLIIPTLLLAAATAFGQAIPGTQVASHITTGSSNLSFSIGDSWEMMGTPKQVPDVTTRNAISALRRSEGMTCWVVADGTEYRLVGGTNNSNWQPSITTEPLAAGTNITFRTVSGTNYIDAAEGFTFASVLDYGADLTGVSDSTTAFKNAVTNPVVYVPRGKYKITSTLYLTNSIRMFGDGAGSRIIGPGITGYLIETTSNQPIYLENLTLDGGVTNIYFTIGHSDLGTSSGNNGLHLNGQGGPVIVGVGFLNWGGIGCDIWGDTNLAARLNSYQVEYCRFTNCWTAVHAGDTNSSEYGQIFGNYFSDNWIQIDSQSANIEVVGNTGHDCNYSIYHHPVQIARGHSLFEANTFNHSVFHLFINNVNTGCLISGNHFLGGAAIRVCDPVTSGDGIQIKNNFFENSTEITDFSLGTNFWFNNTFTANSGPSFTPNAGSPGTGTFGCTNIVEWGNTWMDGGLVWINPHNKTNPPISLKADQSYAVNGLGSNYVVIAGANVTVVTNLTTGQVAWTISSSGGGGSSGATTNEHWLNILDFGADKTGATDSSAAIQSAVNAAVGSSNAATVATIFFPRGIYLITNAPTLIPALTNGEVAQIIFPGKVIASDTWSTVRLLGEDSLLSWPGSASQGFFPTNGTIIRTTMTTNGDVFGFVSTAGTYGWTTAVSPIFQNISFQIGDNFQGTFIEASNCLCTAMLECVGSQAKDTGAEQQPLAGSCFYDMPQSARGNYNYIRNVNVSGFYYGIQSSEHTFQDGRLNLVANVWGLVLKYATLPTVFNNVYIASGGINVIGNCRVQINKLVCEISGTTDWRSNNVWDVYDSGNSFAGTIDYYVQNNVNAGLSEQLRVYGGKYIALSHKSQSDPWGTVYQANTVNSAQYQRGPHQINVNTNGASGAYMALLSAKQFNGYMAAQASGGAAGTMLWGGYDGTTFITPAAIYGDFDAAVSTGVMPTRLGVYTGGGGSGTNRLQFSSGTTVGWPYTSIVWSTNNSYFKSNVISEIDVEVKSNTIANWPAAPIVNGACAIVSSNGFPYILLSTNGDGTGSAAWTGTNKIGW